MQRFRDLVHTRRSWLVVTPPFDDDDNITAPLSSSVSGTAQQYRQQFTSLHDAIACSRPGDTILLHPGIHEASNLVISHPLQLLGDGSCQTPPTLRGCTNGSCTTSSLAAPVLHFAATAGRVSNLAIEGGIGGCIAHYKGRLTLEECFLKCDARGLQHLAAPLVSFASSCRNNISSTNTRLSTLLNEKANVQGEAEGEVIKVKKEIIKNEDGDDDDDDDDDVEEEEADAEIVNNAKPLPPLSSTKREKKYHTSLHLSLLNAHPSFHPILPHGSAASSSVIGAGVVSVVGCTMQGGSTAVQVKGTGAVESVRVIYEAHKSLFWFDVDSRHVGQGGKEEREAAAAAAAAAAADGNPPSCCTFPVSIDNPNPKQEESRDARAAVGTRTLVSPSWLGNTQAAEFDPKALQTQMLAAARR
jgi:hypothetical protein